LIKNSSVKIKIDTMKPLHLLIFFLIANFLGAQEIPSDVLEKMEKATRKQNSDQITQEKDVPIIKRGSILLTDGNSFQFRNLRLINDTVSFRDTSRVAYKYPLDNILSITQMKPQILPGAGYGIVGGGLASAFAGLLIYPEKDFWETLRVLFNNEEGDGPKLSKKAIPIIIGGSLAGAVIGALVGTSSFKEKIIFQNEQSFGFFPEIMNTPGQCNTLMLTCKINLR
jgi:hypothetical protein